MKNKPQITISAALFKCASQRIKERRQPERIRYMIWEEAGGKERAQVIPAAKQIVAVMSK